MFSSKESPLKPAIQETVEMPTKMFESMTVSSRPPRATASEFVPKSMLGEKSVTQTLLPLPTSQLFVQPTEATYNNSYTITGLFDNFIPHKSPEKTAIYRPLSESRTMSPRQHRCIQIATNYSDTMVSVLIKATEEKNANPKSPEPKTPKDKLLKPMDVPVDGFVYLVRFKRAHRCFIIAPEAPRNIMPGSFVKVEADRGEDLGIVLAKIPIEHYVPEVATAGYRGRGFSSGQGERKNIIRFATPHEKQMIGEKVEDEERVLQVSFSTMKSILSLFLDYSGQGGRV